MKIYLDKVDIESMVKTGIGVQQNKVVVVEGIPEDVEVTVTIKDKV